MDVKSVLLLPVLFLLVGCLENNSERSGRWRYFRCDQREPSRRSRHRRCCGIFRQGSQRSRLPHQLKTEKPPPWHRSGSCPFAPKTRSQIAMLERIENEPHLFIGLDRNPYDRDHRSGLYAPSGTPERDRRRDRDRRAWRFDQGRLSETALPDSGNAS